MPITNGAIAKIKHNAAICKLLDGKRLSYAVIAEMTGTTRNVIAGVAFRLRYSPKVRTRSPNSHSKNKIGHGYRYPTYQPEKTAHNTR